MSFNLKVSKFALLAVASTALSMSVANQAMATDQNINASIQARVAISLSNAIDMDFGIVDFIPVHSGTIELGTNGAVALNTPVGITLTGGTPVAGSVDVSGDGASVVDISCDTGGTLTDGAAHTLTLSATEIVVGAGVAFGAGNACAGVGTASTTADLSVTATPTLRIGGAIDTGADSIDNAGTFDTASAGGDPVTVRVVYQ